MTAPAHIERIVIAEAASWWMRAEHLLIVAVVSALALWHAGDIAWVRFVAAFVVIDLIGYLPGAIAFHRSRRGAISRVYYLLYNVTHNYVVAGAAVALWALAIGHLEWAMAAVPIHLSGDRGLFGNFAKDPAAPFEHGAAPSPAAAP